ncbi:hypothetical protein [Frigoribacterium faeni]|uniref:hypothetical protein n=1 Tax=Frigoribacterium faeni TaxID=145483 RepID=UPI00141BDD60|nr:hypothetical protein [Frigoribacterium faeni]NIJ05851.1 hypothetical protein [Frigoribacterium faeni]
MIAAAVAAVLAVGAFVVLSATVRRETLRGTVVAVLLGLHCFAWSPLVPQAICDAVVVASLVLLVLTWASPRPRPTARPHVDVAQLLLVVLFGCACLVTAVAYPPGLGLVARMALLCGLVVAVLSQASAADRRRVVDGVVVVALLQCLAGLVEFVRGEPLLWGYKVYTTGRGLWNENHLLGGGLVRVQGTMSHALPYGTLLMVGLVLLLCTWRRRAPVARWSALLLLLTCITLSGSRSAVVGVVVAAAYLLASSRRAATWQRGSVLAAAAAAMVLLSWTTVSSTADALLDSGSYLNRAGHLQAVPRLLGRPALEAFFGSGESSEARLFARGYFYGTGFNVVDNQLLSSLGTQGLLGAGLVVAVYVASAVRGGRDARASVLVMTSALMTFDFFKMTTMVLLLTVVVCLADPVWARDEPGPGPEPGSGPGRARGVDGARGGGTARREAPSRRHEGVPASVAAVVGAAAGPEGGGEGVPASVGSAPGPEGGGEGVDAAGDRPTSRPTTATPPVADRDPSRRRGRRAARPL